MKEGAMSGGQTSSALTSSALNRQVLRLSALLQLEKRARKAGRAELAFVMVNETASILPYQQAALWQGQRRGRVVALSGVSVPDGTSLYARWLAAVMAVIAGGPKARQIHPIMDDELPPHLAEEWQRHIPAHACWGPLEAPDGRLLGGLLFARTEPWGEADCRLLDHVCDSYAHAWLLTQVRHIHAPNEREGRGRWIMAVIMALVLAGGAMPVRQSVLAPAEVVPKSPELVRAPFDGVVDTLAVDPNIPVKAGQRLLSLDTAQLQARHKVAQKAQDVLMTEYQQAAQLGMTDPRAKARLPVLQGKLEQQQAEVSYLATLLDRATLTAPVDGIVIFDDRTEWVGRPVTQGERIVTVANPSDIELAIQLPVGDAVPLELGAEIAFFLNVAPDAPAEARLTDASYRSYITPGGIMAYRLKAAFADRAKPFRIGLKGTAKIYGGTTPLAMLILRRPIASARQWLTF